MTIIHASLTEIVIIAVIALGVLVFAGVVAVDAIRRRWARRAKKPGSPWASGGQ